MMARGMLALWLGTSADTPPCIQPIHRPALASCTILKFSAWRSIGAMGLYNNCLHVLCCRELLSGVETERLTFQDQVPEPGALPQVLIQKC